MKFKSFLSLFGERRRTKSKHRPAASPRRRADLTLEMLEDRQLLSSNSPRILSALPPDRFTSTNPRPVISVSYSEDMGAGVTTPGNYFLFGSNGNQISIQSVSYDNLARTATLNYNNGANLPADDYTLFIAGDRIFDLDGNGAGGPPLPVAQPGLVIAANSGGQNISTIQMPGDGQLSAAANYHNPSPTGFSLNSSPSSAKLGDVNRDGIADLVVLNRLSNNIEIHFGLNGQDGGFSVTPNITLVANGTPFAMTLQDINGDTIPDILVANQAGNGSVTVYRSAGPGVYSNGQNFNASVGGTNLLPTDVVAADFNGDNNLDLAVSNLNASATGQNLTILPGNASGNFGAPVGFVTGMAGLTGIEVINFDRNTLVLNENLPAPHPDVVVSGSTGLVILRNDTRFPTSNIPTPGALIFTAARNLPGANVNGVDVADLNGDNDPDVVAIADTGNGQVLTFINNGPAGNFNFTPLAPVSANPAGPIGGSTNRGITIANVNNDAFLDVAVVNDNIGGLDTVSILLGAAGVAFAPPIATPLAITDSSPVDLGIFPNVKAINLVGNPSVNPLPQMTQVATANQLGNDATVFQSNFNGTFRVSVETNVPDQDDVRASATGDLNDDGLVDLVTVVTAGNNLSNTLLVQFATSQTTFGPATPFTVGSFPLSVTIGSLTVTRDASGNILSRGPLDIVVANQSDSTITILGNDGAGNFPPALRRTISVGRFPTDVKIGDFNNDGNPDLAVSHNFPINQVPTVPNDRGVSVLFGDGNRGFTGLKEVLPNVEAVALVAADFNNDGNQDLAVLENTRFGSVGSLYYLRGDGRGNFTLFGTFNASEDPSALAVGDLDRDGFLDIVVANKGLTTVNFTSTVYVSTLINNRGLDFFEPTRTDVLANTSDRLTTIAVANLNRDPFPDVLAAFNGDFLGSTINNVVTMLGSFGGTLGDPRFYVTQGRAASVVSTVLAVGSDPFIRVTSFGTRGSAVNNNLIVNGTFEAVDLTREAGNLTGWQTFNQRDSHGYWATQAGFNSPLSASSVTQPRGLRRATLDQPDINLARNSTLGVSASTFNADDRTRRVEDYDGAHALYQDFFIPNTATTVSISFLLYIRNTDRNALGVELNQFGYSNADLTKLLDYFPGVPQRPENQQVRVDLVDPNAPLMSVTEGTDGAVLKRLFQTSQNQARIYDQGSTTPRSVQLGRTFDNGGQEISITLTPAEVLALRGKRVRLRFASANNQGKLIVGVDNVQVAAGYIDTDAPTLNGIRMRNGGFGANSETFGGNTTDTTVVGKVGDEGTARNIDTITFDMDNDGNFNGPNDLPFGRFDAVGNFEFKLPLTLPGAYTIPIRVTDLAGNSFTTSISFNFQGPSLSTWQSQGPGPIRFQSPLVRYTTLSGKITAIANDPRDTDGNVMYVGSDNGGVWKTTDGGHNWTPLTQFLNDPTIGPIPTAISAIEVEPSNPDNVYAATGIADNQPTSSPGVGILKSTDAGKTWILVGRDTFAGARISKVAISRRGLDGITRIYVAVASGGLGQGVYVSQDGGATWTNLLTPTKMFLETSGTPLGAGATLPSVTDLLIDRNSLNEQNIWIGLGNVGLAPDSPNTSVWFSSNAGQTWFRRAGGQLQSSVGVPIPNQIIPTGIGVRRVTLAIGQRASDVSFVYALIDNPGVAQETPLASGLYKTRANGLGWTHVMLRQNRPVNNIVHNYVDLDLFGNQLPGATGGEVNRERDSVGTLTVDPSNPSIVYIGGSTRYFFGLGVAQNPHGLLRVDTSNMRDTEYISPFVGRPTPGNIPNFAPPVIPFDIPNDGDDIFKAADAALNRTNATEPGQYLNGEGYTGEGVFWIDMQMNISGTFQYNQLRLPATIHVTRFDPQGRLLVGTEGGIWRATTTGYVYDVTSGGFASIEQEAGENTPNQPNVNFTDLNGNLQIANQVSVALDPVNLNTIHAAYANLGFAKTTGGLPNSLQWITTIDQDAFFDPFVELTPFAGPVRTGPRSIVPPVVGRPFSTVYRTLANRGLANGAGLTFDPDRQVQKSIQDGDLGTFSSIVNGLDLSTALPAFFPPLAVNSRNVFDDQGVPQDELIFGTNKLYRSTNNGLTWDQISPILTQGTITALGIAASGNQAYYVGTSLGEVFVDLRNGSTPFPLRNQGLPQLQINGIAVDPTNEQTAYLAFAGFLSGQGRIFRTRDGGLTWTDISGQGAGRLPDLPAYAIAVDPRARPGAPNGKLYVGTEVGVFFSVDDGGTWQKITDGIPNVPTRDVTFDPTVETLAVATFGAGTFTLSTDQVGPQVVNIVPGTPTNPGLTTVQVIFNEPVDPRTFTPATIASFVGPNGPIGILSVTPAPNPLTARVDYTYFDVTFLPQSLDGTYVLMLSPAVKDFVGNVMDQNRNSVPGEVPTDNFLGRFAINTNDNGRFLTGIYHDQLNRTADTQGFINFNGAIETGRLQSLFPVALSRVIADETRSHLIAGFYSMTLGTGPLTPLTIGNFLGRQPSQAEITNWVNALKNGATEQQVMQAIVSSLEYFNNKGGSDVNFVNALYLDLLERAGDSGGVNNWLSFIARQDAQVRNPVVGVFTGSREYRTNLVNGYFNRLLGRSPSASEQTNFVGSLSQGATDEQVQSILIGSAEYFNNAGGTNVDWLNKAFQDILGRAVDPQGQSIFLPQLNAGVARQTIALQIYASVEYRRNLVTFLYNKYLHRAPDSSALNNFVPALASGLTQEGLINILVSSIEYYTATIQGATTKNAQDTNWISSVYNDVLGRLPSPQEAGNFVNSLAQSEVGVRGQVAMGFTNSGEFVRRIVQEVYTKYLRRPASSAEVNLWIPVLNAPTQGAGKPNQIETLIASVVASNEYLGNQKDPMQPGQTFQTYSNQSWVTALYNDVVGRPPDAFGNTDALNSVLAGYAAQRLNFANSITTSGEYRTNLVTGYFQTFLRRRGTAAEIAAQISRINSGARDEQIIATLVSSSEYFSNPTLGNNSNSTWLNRVYNDILGRDRDAGSQTFLTQLNAAPAGQAQQVRLQVAAAILDFDEYFNRRINQIYVANLARNAGLAEQNLWRGRIRREGLTLEQVTSNILASPEYFLRGHPYP